MLFVTLFSGSSAAAEQIEVPVTIKTKEVYSRMRSTLSRETKCLVFKSPLGEQILKYCSGEATSKQYRDLALHVRIPQSFS